MNIAFVPARCGSKSITFKNIKLFCGKPLIFWVLEALNTSNVIDKVFVATDCNEIKGIVESFNFSKVSVYDRDKENATDYATTESVMLEFISKNSFDNSDMFFLVQATSPFVKTEDFDKAFAQLKKEKGDSLLTCAKIKRFFWNENGTPINYDYINRPRRQDFNGILAENGAFYINSIENIKRYKNRLSGKIVIYEMPEFTFIELDEEDDWIIAEQLMLKNKIITQRQSKVKLFLSDVDGTLTDCGMYYSSNGEELKKFNTQDGKGFELLRNAGIKTGFITSENTEIVERRAKKLKIDFLFQGVSNKSKLKVVKEICENEGISLQEVAYIGDDINCIDLLKEVGIAACPSNAVKSVKNLSNVIILHNSGGNGAVREFIDLLLMYENIMD